MASSTACGTASSASWVRASRTVCHGASATTLRCRPLSGAAPVEAGTSQATFVPWPFLLHGLRLRRFLQGLEARHVARERARGDGVGAAEPGLPGPGASREVAVDGADADLVLGRRLAGA